jgi:hypothetical protein
MLEASRPVCGLDRAAAGQGESERKKMNYARAEVDGSAFDQSAERSLWCAVVSRALADASDPVVAASSPEERQKLRAEARRWFILNGSEFRLACEAAGFDPDHLRSRVLAIIA